MQLLGSWPRILHAGLQANIALGLLLIATESYANSLPTGGQIVAGSGSIQQSSNTLNINQTSSKLAIDWQSFSIGTQNRVNFNQPSTSAVVLNRVVGADPSVIQGALSANGHVFLINPNGILFNPGSQIHVGGLVASTLNLSNEDFIAGRYHFAGGSRNSVVNAGDITARDGGMVALIAAKIINSGTITAQRGQVVLGSGSRVTLDLGGPVKLQVDEAALNALIENGGAIKADGGLVLLTAKAAGELSTTVINNTGVIEAQTLASGEKGEIYLLGDFSNDRVALGGRLDASAPSGGGGGFIETSAAHLSLAPDLKVDTHAVSGEVGTWLLDPVDFTIAASGGDITGAALATLLGSNNVVVQTATGSNSATNVYGSSGSSGNIYVNDIVSWSANKLTLKADNNININADLNATSTASLAFQYGQGTAAGTGSTYSVASSAKIYIPAATAFTWKKGSSGTTKNLVFDNGLLRFGNGTQASINTNGQLEQPWYFDNTSVVSGVTRNGWFKLTFSNYPLDLEAGVGGSGTSSWNRNGELLNTESTFSSQISGRSLEISKFLEGSGSVVSTVTLTFPSSSNVLKVSNTYTLGQTASFLKTDTVLTNMNASAAISNVRLWVGTRDDYIATRDSQYKFKGNLTSNGFEQIPTQATQSKALKITEYNDGVTGAAVLFYSTSAGADTSISTCCNFTNATGIDPRTSQIFRGVSGGLPNAEDGSYALFLRMADLNAGQSDGMTWYYAAGPVANIANIVTQVANSATPTVPTPEPAPTVQPPVQSAVQAVQTLTVLPGQEVISPVNNPAVVVNTSVQSNSFSLNTNGGLSFVSLAPTSSTSSNTANASSTNGTSAGTSNSLGTSSSGTSSEGGVSATPEGVLSQGGGMDPSGFMRVFVVGGGVKLPADAQSEKNK